MSAAAPTTEMRAKLREWGPVIVLALIPALPLLAGSGLVNTRAGGDSPFLLVRVHQLVLNLRAGIFPVRWMPQAAYGLGYPFFNFYASLPYYLAAALKLTGVGYIWSIKCTQALGFVLAAMSIYGFSRELHHKRSTSLLVALVYSCAPFHMVNVYVRGDSLSEFYAFVFFPLILWSLLRLHRQGSIRNAVWVALSYAGLLLTHNISAMLFSPFVLLYVLSFVVRTQVRQRPHACRFSGLRSAIDSFLALGMGALMSAWFWLPALAERGNVYLRDMTTGYFNYALHFRSLDLVQHSLVFDYAITADKEPFRMGMVQAILALAGLTAVVVWWIQQRRVESHSAFLVLLLAASTFMITPFSRILWDHIPLLPLVQFPWRLLALQALATSLVVAYLVPRQQRWEQITTLLLGLLVLATTLLGLHPERLHIEEADITVQRLMLYEYFTANVGTTIRTDYLPSGVDPRPYTSEVLWQEGTKPAPLAIEGRVASADLQAQGPTFERWVIEVASPESLLAFHTYYYPGWEAHVDGQPTQIEALPSLGYIGLRLGQGQHEVRLRLGHTQEQRIAEILSAVAAGLLLIVLVREVRVSRGMLGIAAAILAALAVLAIGVRALPSPDESGKSITRIDPTDLTMDFDRIPYLHHNPDGIRFGNAAQLTHYELSSHAIQAGETLTVTTYWDESVDNDMVAKLALVSPAQHLFSVPLAVAVSEKPLTTERIQCALHIPASTMRGVYLLSLQVYGPEGEIQPINPRGETLGTTYLLPIRIQGETPASSDEPILQAFGDRIALSRAQTVQHVPGTLEVTLTWLVSASPPQNYKTALRLRDSSGWEVARLDTQPGYGFYPTSMWRPGELVHDRYVLSLDDGTPPGTEYHLDAALYEAASLRPIGTARIPDVVITLPVVRQDYPVMYAFGPAVALSEAQFLKEEWEQGEKLAMVLKWAATAPADRDYECQVALLDSAGTAVHSQTMPLVRGYPSSLWPKDAIIASHYELQLAPDVPVGQYAVTLALREKLSGKEVGTFTSPSSVRVVEAARNFTIPEMQRSIGADFGGQIRLLGYDLQRTEDDLHLTLHWQALSSMTTDYTIFVHLFDPTTETIVAQEDVLAGGDGHPTTRWVPEEVVSDDIGLRLEDVPDGSYTLAMGLYHPEARLPIVAPPGFTVSADRLLLSEAIRVP